MMKKESRERAPRKRPSAECEGPCFNVIGKVANWEDGADILSISRVTLRADDAQPLEDTRTNIATDRMPRALRRVLKGFFGIRGDSTSGEFIDKLGVCDDGCYCDVPENAPPRNTSTAPVTYDMPLVYREVTWVSSFRNPFDPNPGVEGLCGSDGRPVHVDTETQRLGEGVKNNRGTYRFPLTTLYLATVKAKVTVELSERHGECKPIPEDTQGLPGVL